MEWIMDKIMPLIILLVAGVVVYIILPIFIPAKFHAGDFAYMRDDCIRFLVMRSDKDPIIGEQLIVSSQEGKWHNFDADEFVKTPAECAKW